MVAREDRKVVTPGQIMATRTLLKFCRDHALPNRYLRELESCRVALEKTDIDLISRQARLLGHAGMGSFLDWVPPVKFEHENSEYVDVVWNALLGHWLESMHVFRAAEAQQFIQAKPASRVSLIQELAPTRYMNRIRKFVFLFLLTMPPTSGASVSAEEMRDELIRTVASGDWIGQTCRRVEALGKGSVSNVQCLSRVDSANARCIDVAKERVPTVTEELQAKFLVEILMACPVAEVLDIDYVVKSDTIHIQWSQLEEPRSER